MTFFGACTRRLRARGEVVVFNRSHYEDVLVARVHNLVPKAVWSKRYWSLSTNSMRNLVASGGTHILKLFLHISKDEQLASVQEAYRRPRASSGRSARPTTKSANSRPQYVEAYEEAITKTSTLHAPWYVVPATHKWFRNLAVSQILADTMADLDLAFPPPPANLADIRRKYHLAVEQAKGGKKA